MSKKKTLAISAGFVLLAGWLSGLRISISKSKPSLSWIRPNEQIRFSLALVAQYGDPWSQRWTVTTRLQRKPRFNRFFTMYVRVRTAISKSKSKTGDAPSRSARQRPTVAFTDDSLPRAL